MAIVCLILFQTKTLKYNDVASRVNVKTQTFLRQKVTLASSPPANGTGVLRYALHARFSCPLPKRSLRLLQRCKSDPSCAPAGNKDIDGERRFYLYNDLRVVFPQRHSDSDEGKVYFFVY